MTLIIEVVNDETGAPGLGNYDYTVRIADKVVETGRLEKHERKFGWASLLVELAIRGTNRKGPDGHERPDRRHHPHA